MRVQSRFIDLTDVLARAPERLIVIATELFAPGGIQRVGRQVIEALDGCAPLAVGSLLDAAVPSGGSLRRVGRRRPGSGARVRAAGGRLGEWLRWKRARVATEWPWHRPIFPGLDDPSIVGAGAFHYRVRYGNGWAHSALATRTNRSPRERASETERVS